MRQAVAGGSVAQRWLALSGRSRRIIGAGAGGTLALLVVAGLALGGAATSPSPTQQPSTIPDVAAATPSPMLATASPTLWTLDPSYSPGGGYRPGGRSNLDPTDEPPPPTPTLPPNGRRPKSVKTVECYEFQDQGAPVVDGNLIYVDCGLGSGGAETVAVDASTGKVVSKFKFDGDGYAGWLAPEGGIWFSGTAWGACVAGYSCPRPAYISKYDKTLKRVTVTVKGWILAGHGSGYVWGVADGASTVLRIDAASGKYTQIPWSYGDLETACGALWGVKRAPSGTTTLTRVDPDTGAALDSFTEEGSLSGLAQHANGCWAVAAGVTADVDEVAPPSLGVPAPEDGHHRFVQIGPDGVDYRSPTFNSDLEMLDGTFWTTYGAPYSDLMIQRIDPSTWSSSGPVWVVEGISPHFAAGGFVWFFNDDGYLLVRSDISLALLPGDSAPTPSPVSSSSATPFDDVTPSPPAATPSPETQPPTTPPAS